MSRFHRLTLLLVPALVLALSASADARGCRRGRCGRSACANGACATAACTTGTCTTAAQAAKTESQAPPAPVAQR